MSRINSNVQSMIAQRVLTGNNNALNSALERLSTGVKLVRGKDDPAGLIASENLRAEQKALGQALANADRADQVMNIAEGGLQELSGLLTELQGILTATASDAGLSQEEKDANQLQIDSILGTIDRISNATNFQGIKLLNGNFDFTTSGRNTANVSSMRINGAKFSGASMGVNVAVTQSAQRGGLFLSLGTSNLDLSSATAQLKFEVGGKSGTREFTFASGTSLTQIRDVVNQFTDVTGVSATVSGTGVRLVSEGFGSKEIVSVRSIDDGGLTPGAGGTGIYGMQATNFGAAQTTQIADFADGASMIRDTGRDVQGTINGAAATGIGLALSLSTDFLDVSVGLSVAQAQTIGNVDGAAGAGTPAFSILDGGANFQLSSRVDMNGKVSLGIAEMSTSKLGSVAQGFLNSLASGQVNNAASGDIQQAQDVVNEAIRQVSSVRGRLGAFQKNVVGATIRSLNINLENTTAAQSIVRDADFAVETANLTRQQILVSASTNVLSLANSQPQSALQLLG